MLEVARAAYTCLSDSVRQPNSFTLRRRDLPLGIGFKRLSKAESKPCLDMASLGGVSTCRLLSKSLSGLRIRRLRSSQRIRKVIYWMAQMAMTGVSCVIVVGGSGRSLP